MGFESFFLLVVFISLLFGRCSFVLFQYRSTPVKRKPLILKEHLQGVDESILTERSSGIVKEEASLEQHWPKPFQVPPALLGWMWSERSPLALPAEKQARNPCSSCHSGDAPGNLQAKPERRLRPCSDPRGRLRGTVTPLPRPLALTGRQDKKHSLTRTPRAVLGPRECPCASAVRVGPGAIRMLRAGGTGTRPGQRQARKHRHRSAGAPGPGRGRTRC